MLAAEPDEELHALLRECEAIDRACAHAVQPCRMSRGACGFDDEDAACCVCFEALNAPEAQLWRCELCQNTTHAECFDKWRRHNNTCPMCRHVSSHEQDGTACCCMMSLALFSFVGQNLAKLHGE